MALQLGPSSVVIDHDTGGTDALAVKDSAGNPVQFARILAYLRSDYDENVIVELGVADTDENGRWVEPIVLPGVFAGEQLYLLVYRAAGSRRTDDGVRRWLAAWGPTQVEIQAPTECLLDNSAANVLDEDGLEVCPDLDPGAHPLAILDEDGAAITDENGAQVLASAAIG